jgi:XTP/dITP diphosphohydrolase
MKPAPHFDNTDRTPLLVLATGNAHKVGEIAAILSEALPGRSLRLASSSDYPGVPEPEETGETFEANAALKARYWAKATGALALADDSGLVVDALDGRPGVRSARYDSTSERRNARLLGELDGIEEDRRTARFVCAAALADPGGDVLTAEGRTEGRITFEPAGEGGFGYDPVFEPEGQVGGTRRTLAQYSAGEKNRISHRGGAIRALASAIAEALDAGAVVSRRSF